MWRRLECLEALIDTGGLDVSIKDEEGRRAGGLLQRTDSTGVDEATSGARYGVMRAPQAPAADDAGAALAARWQRVMDFLSAERDNVAEAVE